MEATHSQPFANSSSLPPDWSAVDDDAACYCPRRLLASFALLMAGHGRCVIIDMMIGDRQYAMEQLACARGMDDAELTAVVQRLADYFGDTPDRGLAADRRM